MSSTDIDWDHTWSVPKYAISLAAGWTLLLAVIMFETYITEMKVVREFVKNEAEAHYLKDQAFRSWASSHGGVYVPPTDHTPSNPNLAHLPNRDIVTTDGMKLTLMNPAYMARQFMEDYEEQYGIIGHITSLKPLRQQNAQMIGNEKLLSHLNWEVLRLMNSAILMVSLTCGLCGL